MPIAIDNNLLAQKSNLSIIEAAEQQLGSLTKVEKEYIDQKTGSIFQLEIAAKSQDQINDFLLNHKIEFVGINQSEKEELLKKFKSGSELTSPVKPETPIDGVDDFSFDEVFYDLKSKTLKGDAVGYSFVVKPLKRETQFKSTNLRPEGINWIKQTSLKWCEWAVIAMITEPVPTNYSLYEQYRGIFWNGLGKSIRTVTTGGNQYNYNCDGPKYTRFGGYDPVKSKIDFVVWFDLESGQSVTRYN